MTKAIKLDYELANSWYLRGLSYLKLKRPDLACADLSKAAKLGVGEATEAMKGVCLPQADTDVESQGKFSNKKLSKGKHGLRFDFYRLNFTF